MENTDQALEEIAKLLALQIRLQLGNQAQAVVEMNRVGLGPSRIAALLGTTAGTVNVALNRAKTQAHGKP